MSRSAKYIYEFGPFHLDTVERRLLRERQHVPLTPKAYDILLLLVQNNGHMLEKDELMKEVWPDSFVEEGNLTRYISTLRKTLGRNVNGQQYIETISKRGYRFVAQVSESQVKSAEILTGRLQSPPALRSIAVIPFNLIGAESGDEYLGLGMADALITKLSNIRQIITRPTSAVRKYLSHRQDFITLGRELRVDALLEGSVQRRDEHIRVTVQLVNVQSETTLWAEKFNEKFTDLFALEDSISEQVAETLMLKLTSEEKKRLTKRYTDDIEAYQAYLKGRYFWNKRTREGIKKGIGYFRQAIEIDPLYALAYAGLADSYNLLAIYGDASPREIFPKAKAAAAKALEIDETLAEAHTSLAFILHRFDWDWAEADREFRRSIALNPDYPTTHHWYGNYLMTMGRETEAMEEMERAQQLDPLSLIIDGNIGNFLYVMRRYDRAINHFQKMLEMEANFHGTHSNLGNVYEQKGMYEEAIAEFEKALVLDANLSARAWLGHAYAIAGKRGKARKIINDLKERAKKYYVSPYDFAIIYLGLGERDEAFALLEKAYEERNDALVWIKFDPRLDSIRTDTRFRDLMQRVGLAP
ncbi:MAG TPA: tetratricopeptide repeat protein [Pyrinomonadaceae bacterium]|nr:tetratricopeptide repeat protein [Pyrinomonadaceae bacterium]